MELLVDQKNSCRWEIDESRAWKKHELLHCDIALAGATLTFQAVRNSLDDVKKLSSKKSISKFLARYSDCYGLILVTNDYVFAATDHIRSFPIYFTHTSGEFVIGNSAPRVRAAAGLKDVDLTSVEDYLLSGYVHGSRTLFRFLSALPAGKLLTFDRRTKKLSIDSLFCYRPTFLDNSSWDAQLQEFGQILDEIFSELVGSIGNRSLFVPLSGGLDSRLVLSKLIEHGAPNIRAFTYGNNRSHEMKMARTIAQKLGVEWIPVPSCKTGHRSLYNSQVRLEYAHYADGLHMTPVLLDFEAIYRLRSRGVFPRDAVIINGYSGDFLFGGHIPAALLHSPSTHTLVEKFMEKNYANFSSKKMNRARKIMGRELEKQVVVENNQLDNAENYCGVYEQWDWAERQTKAVVNGQRVYEFFDLDWRLPLWDKRLVEFWAKAPLDSKINQALHISYLKKWNYSNAFNVLRSANQAWPGLWRWVGIVGPFIGLMFGRKIKGKFYEYMFYRSYFNYQLALFGRKTYNQWYKVTRRPRVIPLASMQRLSELGIEFEHLIIDGERSKMP
jgi:asparagine synthase (glutamine-hydrolysing)